MIRHFLKSTFRNINKMFSLINLTNLAIGFTTFILLGLVVSFELSYDKSNKNFDRIYRVQTRQEDSYPINYCTFSPAAYRYHLLEDLPEVEQVLLMREISGGQGAGQFFTLPDGGQLYEKRGYWSENSIFDIFTIQLTEGTSINALTEPNTIVLSESLRKKLFPDSEAIGKQVVIGKRYPLVVTAVYSDFPRNSDMRPSYLISMSTYASRTENKGFRENWTNISNDNYVLLKKGTNPKSVDLKIKDAFKYVKNFEKSTPYLYPLSKHHISPNSQPDFIIGLSVLSLAGFLVLILSCVNYVNLSLANSTVRAHEIGIRKVMGSSKNAIAVQFMTETLTITFLAMFIGLIAAWIISPLMTIILQKDFVYNVFGNKQLLLIVLLVGLLAGLISGLYPSVILSAYNPVRILKGKLFRGTGKSINLKKILTSLQFSISLFMLIVSFILFRHVNFLINKDLGFDSKNIIISEVNPLDKVDFETIHQRLLQHPEIVNATFSSTIPFQGNIGGWVSWDGASPDQREMISRNYVNYDFIPTYNLKIVEGRNFSKEHPSDYESCIINETALKVFGWSDPIGKRILLSDKFYTVIGVVKDFHPFSVHNIIPSYIMFLSPNELSGPKLLTVRFASGKEETASKLATSELEAVIPRDPFEFKSFEEIFLLDLPYTFWQTMKHIFTFFTIITLLISSIGLFGLILFTIRRRTKEIGIRKVLGSSVVLIYKQLLFEVLGSLGIAVLIACPSAWYVYKNLPGAYKEALPVTVFVLAIGLIALVAVITISYHVLKVALTNPVKTLREE